MLTAIHILLTYRCTYECDHCFLHCSPRCEGTFTLQQLRELFRQIATVPAIDTVYFEGGEPFLFYAALLAGLRMVRDAGLRPGIVTNGYWATSLEDAELWLRPMLGLGIVDFSVSDDAFHSTKGESSPGAIAFSAAQNLGFPCSRICIHHPSTTPACNPAKGQPVTGGRVLFKGRAAEKLTAGLPLRDYHELTACPHEELADPERVHVDAYGNVHVCQGISIGNVWTTPLSDLVSNYCPDRHPIVGPLITAGPAGLAESLGLELAESFVDECHLCYTVRKLKQSACPQTLTPPQVYGF